MKAIGLPLLIMSISIFSVACDKKPDTKSNISSAVEKELVRERACVPVNLDSWEEYYPPREPLDPLVKAGLLHRDIRSERGLMGRVTSQAQYVLTEKGKPWLLREGERPDVFVSTGANYLCYGQKQFVDLVRYTEPSSMVGMTMTRVTYTWKLDHIADWARDLQSNEWYKEVHEMLSHENVPKQDEMTLVLSNDGWHQEKEKRTE